MRNNFFQEHVAIKGNFNFQHKKATLKIQSLDPTPTCYWSRTLFILNCFAFSPTKEDKTLIRKCKKNQPQDNPVKFTVTSGSNYYPPMNPDHASRTCGEKATDSKKSSAVAKVVTASALNSTRGPGRATIWNIKCGGGVPGERTSLRISCNNQSSFTIPASAYHSVTKFLFSKA